MGQDADQLRRDIEVQRANMSQTVAAIEDRVVPGRVVDRQKAQWRQRWTDARHNVMGAPDQGGVSGHGHSAMDSGHDAVDTAREKAGDAAQAVREAPQAVAQQAKGNPLFAGAVAFGLGALIGSVAPTTEPERRAIKEMEPQIERSAEELKEGAQVVAQEVKTEAQDRAQELKETARDSGESLSQEAKQSAAEVTDHAKQEGQATADHARSEAQRNT
jgi:gas vesicle protein